jgi:inorganic pyrophosphatase
MTRDLTKLAPYDDEGALRVVVESPRGSSLKLEYDPAVRMFSISRELPLGIAYPFDWGFIPGTLGEDGDPLDAMALHHATSFPGVLLPCRILGMVEVVQREGRGRPQVNNRIITTPHWHRPLAKLTEARDLPLPARREIEQFFVAAAAMTGKRLTLKGWASRRTTEKFVEANLV